MQFTRLNILIMGVSLVVIGIVLHLFYYELSDFILGIGLLFTLYAAYRFTYDAAGNNINDKE